jgi:quercetin dioxygenase-like cupin family protein
MEEPMKSTAALLLFQCLMSARLGAQEPTITTLLSRDLANAPGREVLVIAVEYPPGGFDPIHRHHAQAVVYVLEGRVEMQVSGRQPVTLAPGQTFYEGPEDVHLVARNASQTAPAKFLVFFVKDTGTPVKVPAK